MVRLVEIIQISDLHYDSGFRKEYMENVISYINNTMPDVVICTGDIVHKGDLLATVGTSGGFAKPSLYFAIRHNGDPVDPKLWCK